MPLAQAGIYFLPQIFCLFCQSEAALGFICLPRRNYSRTWEMRLFEFFIADCVAKDKPQKTRKTQKKESKTILHYGKKMVSTHSQSIDYLFALDFFAFLFVSTE
jgi:hypothetical protein